jgi:hypothetical protein
MPAGWLNHAWAPFIGWNLVGFGAAFFLNSFVEWAVHRFIMHKPSKLIPYGYLHTTSHHRIFGADETYHVVNPQMMEHGTAFTWKEFVLFPLLCLALYAPVEFLTGKPTTVGALAAVFCGLISFNFLHYRFHVPSDSWFQRTWLFQYLKEHHRRHHEDMKKNFNVSFFPLADWLLGTLKR